MIQRTLRLSLFSVCAGLAAMQAARSFDVASIRRVDPARQRDGEFPSMLGSGRFVYASSTYGLILKALQIRGCGTKVTGNQCGRIVGGPGWIGSESYLIQATLPAGTPNYSLTQFMDGAAAGIYPMLEALLRERFAFKYHRETRELPAFVLTLDRSGHKLKPTEAKMISRPDGTQRLERSMQFMPFNGANGQRMLRLKVVNLTLAELAEKLSSMLNRPVVDQTGLPGGFDFEMEYAADPDNLRPGAELTGPELFTALHEQAGLRLESTRSPVEVVVIDHIERPSKN